MSAQLPQVEVRLHNGRPTAFIEGWLFDHSPLMTWRWREFLKARYGAADEIRFDLKAPETRVFLLEAGA